VIVKTVTKIEEEDGKMYQPINKITAIHLAKKAIVYIYVSQLHAKFKRTPKAHCGNMILRTN
jgi:hypothetical protein